MTWWVVTGTCLPKLIYHMGKRVNGNGLMLFHLGNAMSGGGELCSWELFDMLVTVL